MRNDASGDADGSNNIGKVRTQLLEGASQSGKIVKVFPQERQTPRRTQIVSC